MPLVPLLFVSVLAVQSLSPEDAHWVRQFVPSLPLAAARAQEVDVDHEALFDIRRSYLDYWNELGDEELSGLERFALTVQRVVDTRARLASPGPGGEEAARRLLLDDLVDLFVGSQYGREKSLLMSTPALLGEAAIRESDYDLSGFAEPLRSGEGRFRHFVLNAAASSFAPDVLVDLAARIRGGDLVGSGSDSRADVLTNEIGRDFAKLLRRSPLRELGDGRTVREWLVDRFGE